MLPEATAQRERFDPRKLECTRHGEPKQEVVEHNRRWRLAKKHQESLVTGGFVELLVYECRRQRIEVAKPQSGKKTVGVRRVQLPRRLQGTGRDVRSGGLHVGHGRLSGARRVDRRVRKNVVRGTLATHFLGSFEGQDILNERQIEHAVSAE